MSIYDREMPIIASKFGRLAKNRRFTARIIDNKMCNLYLLCVIAVSGKEVRMQRRRSKERHAKEAASSFIREVTGKKPRDSGNTSIRQVS